MPRTRRALGFFQVMIVLSVLGVAPISKFQRGFLWDPSPFRRGRGVRHARLACLVCLTCQLVHQPGARRSRRGAWFTECYIITLRAEYASLAVFHVEQYVEQYVAGVACVALVKCYIITLRVNVAT